MTFDEDMARGHLETGESLEAAYGSGPWSRQQEPEPEYYGDECPHCGAMSWYCNDKFLECEECGKTYEDNLPA